VPTVEKEGETFVLHHDRPKSIGRVRSFFGNFGMFVRAFAYILALGPDGLRRMAETAVLNANYLRRKLEAAYHLPYDAPSLHEVVFSDRNLEDTGVHTLDIAKRLMDYGFHAPTVSFPVPGTMMIEPTESEPKGELDRFCDALVSIRKEIQAVLEGRADAKDNVLKNAPHTADAVTSDTWSHPYSREQAAYPLPWVKANKVWPSVSRIDNPYGDRNLICACPPIEAYSNP